MGFTDLMSNMQFLSTPSARRATLSDKANGREPSKFLSTPSARRATPLRPDLRHREAISIHALREEGDLVDQPVFRPVDISIHALREEGDWPQPGFCRPCGYFYPRPPRGGRPGRCRCARAVDQHFYPRPPRGGRLSPGKAKITIIKFLSTPSARRATDALDEGGALDNLFLSTPSARRATAKTETKSLFSNKLYNILHEFRRALIYNGSKNYPNHAK